MDLDTGLCLSAMVPWLGFGSVVHCITFTLVTICCGENLFSNNYLHLTWKKAIKATFFPHQWKIYQQSYHGFELISTHMSNPHPSMQSLCVSDLSC